MEPAAVIGGELLLTAERAGDDRLHTLAVVMLEPLIVGAYLSEARGNEVLARRAWAAAIGAIGISPALLVADLGRPGRFLNMLRMVKVTSPMSQHVHRGTAREHGRADLA